MKNTKLTRFCEFYCVLALIALFATTAIAGSPLKGVDVKLGKNPGGSPMYSARTDGDGKFNFPKLPPGVYTLYIAYDQVSQIAIKENGVKKLTPAGGESATAKLESPNNFQLDLDESSNVTLESTGTANNAAMKRQHSPITITKEWGANASKVTITVSQTGAVSGKVTYNLATGKKS